MSNKGGRVSPDYLADIAPEYAIISRQILLFLDDLADYDIFFTRKHRFGFCCIEKPYALKGTRANTNAYENRLKIKQNRRKIRNR